MAIRVAVVGGAGYIGSHMCKRLDAAGYDVTVVDDLSTGHAQAVQWGRLARASLADADALDGVFRAGRFEAVFHFAGLIVVSESVADPLAYYQANLAGTLNLLAAMRHHQVPRLIFSSTAAVYGEPRQALIDETHPIAPISPYGHSKAMVEQVLRDAAAAHGLDTVALRYFNAAGADPAGRIGEAHEPETHLIPRLLQLAGSPQAEVAIYGDDFETPDGTCVRDYVHVDDLCEAHLAALDHLRRAPGFHVYNLGNGRGHSVREVVEAVSRVTGRRLQPRIAPRRSGDPARLVASPERAFAELGWQPRSSELAHIVETAWRWHCARRY